MEKAIKFKEDVSAGLLIIAMVFGIIIGAVSVFVFISTDYQLEQDIVYYEEITVKMCDLINSQAETFNLLSDELNKEQYFERPLGKMDSVDCSKVILK